MTSISYSRTGDCNSWDSCRGERISLVHAGLLSTPEVEPETDHSSVGGMLPYWALPQGFLSHLVTCRGPTTRFFQYPRQEVVSIISHPIGGSQLALYLSLAKRINPEASHHN